MVLILCAADAQEKAVSLRRILAYRFFNAIIYSRKEESVKDLKSVITGYPAVIVIPSQGLFMDSFLSIAIYMAIETGKFIPLAMDNYRPPKWFSEYVILKPENDPIQWMRLIEALMRRGL